MRRPTLPRLARGAALMAGVLALTLLPTSAFAAPAGPRVIDDVPPTADFPPDQRGYHTNAEMLEEVARVAAAHPGIVRRLRIGTSAEGRGIWAAKVSDNVGVDENESEVLFDGLTHAREHITLEMTLSILHLLADNYGSNTRITNLVRSREIWIVFAVNPDGGVYDLTGDPYREWRKNRQPNPGSSYVGTDLNRNFGYHWACCGGSSGSPASDTYRGAGPFSAPETRVIRDFINGRVVDGRQQIRTSISFHAAGEQILWPYGYTYTDIPYDMTRHDHDALAAMARAMAATNGYVAQQSSTLYVTDGDYIDWAYGVHRIFTYTFEMYPDPSTSLTRFYPPDEVIPRETRRNHAAVLYLIEQADCPYRAIGLTITHCGAFLDDFEINRGWRRDPSGSDTATAGAWQRANPQSTASSGSKQLGTPTSGSIDLVTGAAAGGSVGAHDVDGGRTSIMSPGITLPNRQGQRLTFRYTFAHGANASSSDFLHVSVVGPSGSRIVLDEHGKATDRDAQWLGRSVSLDDFAGQRIRVRITAADEGGASLIEAAVDDVRVTRP